MFRLFLVLTLISSSASAFGVVPRPTRLVHSATMPLYAAERPVHEQAYFLSENGYGDVDGDGDGYEAKARMDMERGKPRREDGGGEIVDKMKVMTEMVSTTWQDLSSKATNFAQDERVQELAIKAKDFVTDVVGQLFVTVGDKLKEMKEKKAQDKKMMMEEVQETKM